MICPFCYSNDSEFVEVSIQTRIEEDDYKETYGVAVECLNCGLRGPGAFEENDDANNQLALEHWESLALINEESRRIVNRLFINTPIEGTGTLTGFVLDQLLKVKEEERSHYEQI